MSVSHALSLTLAVVALQLASLLGTATSFSAASPSTTSSAKPFVNVGFEQWVADAPDEVIEPRALEIKGEIPSYVRGSLVRNGGGKWTLDESTKSAHIFDGLAKLSLYQIGTDDDDKPKVLFCNRFVESKLKDAFEERGNVPTVHTGPLMDTKTNQVIPQDNWFQALLNIPWFDNTPVNIWRFHNHNKQEGSDPLPISCLTDTPIRAKVDPATLQTLQRAVPPPAAKNAPGFYELTGTAHPEYCKKGTGASYNVGTHIGLPPTLCLIRDNTDGTREVVAKYPLPENQIPYLHSFGLTPTKAVIVLQPLRQTSNFQELLKGGFLPTMEHVETTKALVFDLETGGLLVDVTLPENVYYYHTISSIDTSSGGVSTKLCGYPVPDLITGPDQFFRFDRASTPEGRNRIHRGGMICTIEVDNLEDDATATVEWIPVVDSLTQTRQGFELPTTRYSRIAPPVGEHPRFAYAFGSHARGSPDYDAWAILKIDTQTGQATSFREGDSCYYSEPIFVANPQGTQEDDGVLLCTRLDGTTCLTSLLVLEARTMELLGEACTNTRVTMDFHGAFFADDGN